VRQDGDAAGRINPPHAGRRNGKEIGKDGIVVHRQSVTDVQIAQRTRHGPPDTQPASSRAQYRELPGKPLLLRLAAIRHAYAVTGRLSAPSAKIIRSTL